MARKRSKKKPKPKQRAQQPRPLIVGPSYIQILQHADFLGKHVTLVLCGETHEDAIDVTRTGGRVEPKEGWVEHTAGVVATDWLACRILATQTKSMPLEQGQEWSKHRVENDEEWYAQVALLWVPEGQPTKKKQKGRSYLLEFALTADDMEEEEEDDHYGSWVLLDHNEGLTLVMQLIPNDDVAPDAPSRLFEWADLDMVAHALNRRRVSTAEVPTDELDTIVVQRQKELKAGSQPIWTWDEWFSHVRKQAAETESSNVQLILECPIHPWEVQLHRPTSIDNPLPTAPDYIRCLPEDEETDEDDRFDPASDGVGSYIEFVHRKFLQDVLSTNGREETWFHCVDNRDLGCETAVTTDAVKERWMSLLHQDERESLDEENPNHSRTLEHSALGNYVKFLPSDRMNPEHAFAHDLQSKGDLICCDDSSKDKKEVTFPSFEGFFGQSSDCMYYSPHIRLAYSPFLAKCVGSLPKWETFFSELFFGGSVQEALAVLNLDVHRDATHVRSPILQRVDSASKLVEYIERDDGEQYITFPYLPSVFYLVAAGDESPSQEQTWSSALFTKLHGSSDERCSAAANTIRAWILEKIAHQSNDPKCADDNACGGEWFEAYLRAFHRDIYDDIDRSDASALLRATRVKSESSEDRKRYDLGRIVIPNTKHSFEQILQRFSEESTVAPSELITPQIECMAKILIDIWMSNLVDFSTMLKVASVVAESQHTRALVVCYLGSAHTRAVADCFITRFQFRRESFVGKVDWDEGEPRTLQLPSALWELGE